MIDKNGPFFGGDDQNNREQSGSVGGNDAGQEHHFGEFWENNFGKNTLGKGGSVDGSNGEEVSGFGEEGEDDGTFVGNTGTGIYQIRLANLLHLVILSTYHYFLYF